MHKISENHHLCYTHTHTPTLSTTNTFNTSEGLNIYAAYLQCENINIAPGNEKSLILLSIIFKC